MKKAKIMLIAIAVIAIAGAALAFKARTFDRFDLCTTTHDPVQGCPNLCTSLSTRVTAELDPDFPDFCFTVLIHDDANDDLTCRDINCPSKGKGPIVD